MAGILIVDDDPTIRAMFARALKPLGDVETAGNGAEALWMLGAKRYGVVLLDLHMPLIDGFVLLHTLSSKAGPNRDTPIFVITADNSEQARLKALRRHAVFLLTKPVPIATLTSLVDSTLKKAAARAEEDGAPDAGATGAATEGPMTDANAPPSSIPGSAPSPRARPAAGGRGGDHPPAGGPRKPGG